MLDEMPARVDTFEQSQTVALVEESLGQLNERYRTALVLKDLHGLPPEEIADVMEISRPNADVLVHRARASFKTVFAKLAGDVPAPASLGLVLAPLTVPAVLHAMPPLPHLGTAAPHGGHAAPHVAPHSAPHVAPHAVPHPGPALNVPHGAGLLAKLGAALTTKAAITAAAATVIVGGAVGGTVAVRDVQQAHAHRSSGSLRPRMAASLCDVEQAVGPLEPLLELDAARLADGLELRPLELEQRRGLVVADEQRLHLVERRFADGQRRQLERRQLDDVDERLVQLGLVLCQELVELVGLG